MLRSLFHYYYSFTIYSAHSYSAFVTPGYIMLLADEVTQTKYMDKTINSGETRDGIHNEHSTIWTKQNIYASYDNDGKNNTHPTTALIITHCALASHIIYYTEVLSYSLWDLGCIFFILLLFFIIIFFLII